MFIYVQEIRVEFFLLGFNERNVDRYKESKKTTRYTYKTKDLACQKNKYEIRKLKEHMEDNQTGYKAHNGRLKVNEDKENK